MTLEEAIKHCEEVAKENDDAAKEFYRVSKLETHPDRELAEDGYVECKKCADEHRQLAEWLKELKAVYDEIDDADDEDEIFIGYLRKKMEKHIPLKPEQSKIPRYGMGYEYYDWYCPTCGRFLAFEPSKGDHHCTCGQAIDWEGE